MAVQQQCLFHLLQLEPPRLTREELLEEQRALRQLVESHHRQLVAQRKEAGGLKANDRYPTRGVGRERLLHLRRLALRFIDHADREKRPATAKAARRKDAVSRGLQHLERSTRVFRFEVAVEGVDEEDNVGLARSLVPE